MNWDLRKAEQALARGEVEEARVYAWNALATIRQEDVPTLLRIAEQCEDKLLILELERRELPGQSEPAQISLAGRIVRTSLLAVLVIAVLVTMFGASLREAGPLEPRVTDPSPLAPAQLPLLREGSGIWLVRIGHSERVPLQKLADDLFFRYRLSIGVLPEIETIPSSAVDEREHELIGEELIALLSRWYGADGDATFIGVTDYAMRSRDLDLSGTFSLRGAAHYGVVSTSDLGANVPDRIRGNTRYKRTRKLVARNIGYLSLGMPESANPRSLFRSSMSSVDDIDALDEKL